MSMFEVKSKEEKLQDKEKAKEERRKKRKKMSSKRMSMFEVSKENKQEKPLTKKSGNI